MKHTIGAVALLAMFSSAISSAEPAVTVGKPRYAQLHEPLLGEVRLNDAFWAPRIETCREVTLPYCFAVCEETGRIENFVNAAKGEGKFEGIWFNDSDVHKVIEGAAYSLRLHPDPRLDEMTDAVIAKIAAAQQDDGYILCYFILGDASKRFTQIHKPARHELYTMGHLIEAGAVHYQMTGKRSFLEVAARAADHVDARFGPGKNMQVPEHQEMELALIKLYRVTGEERYLDLAKVFIDQRGNAGGHPLYGSYSQDHLPVRDQRDAVGHAVRAMYNCMGMLDLYAETGDEQLLDACRRIWQSATHRRMYVTGGVGATRRGEAFGEDYDLPNSTAYAETCAQIGLIHFARRLFMIEPDGEYADVMERVLYNSFLSGLSISGNKFFYQNRLAANGDYRRQPWYGCACCPSNVIRVYPRLGQFMYALGKSAVYVNLYASGTGEISIDGKQVLLKQETRYPWDGRVVLRVEPPEPQAFDICLRIPGWCRQSETPGALYRSPGPQEKPVLRVNGKTGSLDKLEKGYARVSRKWKAGDTIELDLPMPVRRVYAHPEVRADGGRVALQRGPVVYCAEAVDNGGRVSHLSLPADAELTAEHRPDLLGGVTVIKGKAGKHDLLAVPYYAWDNREGGEMAVWLREESPDAVYWPHPHPPTDGMVGANYTGAYAVNQVQFWHDFREAVVEREIAAARRYYGINTLRVYLHNINFDEEKDVFLANIETFLKICDKHGIKPGFCFFDDCHRHADIYLDKPTSPVKGYHNGRWAACPQDRDRDPGNLDKFKPYIQEVIRPFRQDNRVLWWEVFNEPGIKKGNYSERLREAAYRWAKEVGPVQPVIACWDDNEATDIVNAHNYRWGTRRWDKQADMNPDKGTVFTEAGARWFAPRPSNGEPCEVMHWLEARRATGKSTPGVYLCWELFAGNSNCRWYWGTKQGSPEPTIPWCGLMWPDATPVSFAEAEACLRYTTGESRALFYDNFQDTPTVERAGWQTFGVGSPVGSGVLAVPAGTKMIAGDPAWKDYVLEAVVMLKGTGGNAGLVFRVSKPGHGHDEMQGYYVGFDTEKLYLGKMSNNWRPLAEYDLGKLDCKVVPGVWNQIRVAAKGNRIRVWFNRMHPSSDTEKGLRIEVTDETAPILSGSVGVRAYQVDAWFDNIVVIPANCVDDS